MRIPKYFYFRVRVINKGTGVEIEDASDADVEEVVRCKDCLFWGLHRTWLKGNEVNMQDCFVNEMMTKPDFFCASGEKKELKEIEDGTDDRC